MYQDVGVQRCQCTKMSVYQDVSAPRCQCTKMSVHQDVSVPRCRCTKMLMHQDVDAPRCRCTNMLMHQDVGVPRCQCTKMLVSDVKPYLGAPLWIFPQGFLLRSFPQGDNSARQQEYEVSDFPVQGELPKAIEPHLPVYQSYLRQLGPIKWSSPATKNIDPILVTPLRVGLQRIVSELPEVDLPAIAQCQRSGQWRRHGITTMIYCYVSAMSTLDRYITLFIISHSTSMQVNCLVNITVPDITQGSDSCPEEEESRDAS